jgi:hypothetical protein
MKMWKYGIIIISMSMLVLSSAVVSAEPITDGQNDIIKTTGPGTFATDQSKPEIDIKQITCTIDDTTLTLELEIWDAGTIQQAEHYMYFATVNTTDFKYDISLMDGGRADIFDRTNPDNMPDAPDLEIGTHSIKAVFQLQGSSTIEELWGWATYVSDPLYQDWAPDNRGPEGSFGEDTPPEDDDDTDDDTTDDDTTDDTTDDDTTDDDATDDDDEDSDDTPGFEAIAVIAAVGIALILLKRRK